MRQLLGKRSRIHETVIWWEAARELDNGKGKERTWWETQAEIERENNNEEKKLDDMVELMRGHVLGKAERKKKAHSIRRDIHSGFSKWKKGRD